MTKCPVAKWELQRESSAVEERAVEIRGRDKTEESELDLRDAWGRNKGSKVYIIRGREKVDTGKKKHTMAKVSHIRY